MDGIREDRWLSLYEIADYLGIKPATVYMSFIDQSAFPLTRSRQKIVSPAF